jgi:polysaccharide biosynthesis/export protein
MSWWQSSWWQSKVSCAAIALGVVMVFPGCAGWISGSGPSRSQVREDHDSARLAGIQLVDVNDELARKLAKAKRLDEFSQVFPELGGTNLVVGHGDIIEVSVWEAQPAMLFGSMANPVAGTGTAQVTTLPPQMVAADGMITIPFAGRIGVSGLTPDAIEAVIVKALDAKTTKPQAIVRVVKNNSAIVTVVGEVAASTLMPLTPKGERLLDALAAAAGVKHEISRMAVRITRAGTIATMPLDLVIRDPRQNVPLFPGDVVTAIYQSQRFSVLGATGKNEEIPFEAQGISLAQALARSGGLNDTRADARAVFVFRFEQAELVETNNQGSDGSALKTMTVDGTVPVVYQVDLRDPASLFVAQNFQVQDRDVLYVANSPEAEFRKFLSLAVSVASPAYMINRSVEGLVK